MRTDYEQLAARYDDDRARWSVPRDDVIDELLAVMGSGSSVRVLDLGCGTGRWLAAQREFFVDRTVEWLGVDPSSAMLAEANAKGLANILRARAEELPLPDASIDYVASNYTFHHFSDKESALDEMHRVLTRCGVFRVNNIEPAAAEGWWLYEFFPEAIAIDADRFWQASRIAEALQARQFEQVPERSRRPRRSPRPNAALSHSSRCSTTPRTRAGSHTCATPPARQVRWSPRRDPAFA